MASRFRSKFEKRIAHALESAGAAFEYESIKIPFVKNHHYTPDFVLSNGVILEAKGRFIASDRTKHLLIREQNPEFDIRFVFQRAKNRINPRSKTTYAGWCDRHGFLWCEGKLPKQWLL
tara:strand:+ start:1820 stop:2176 length:357 start_codon:yes stop_codon:yes gene_type:complete